MMVRRLDWPPLKLELQHLEQVSKVRQKKKWISHPCIIEKSKISTLTDVLLRDIIVCCQFFSQTKPSRMANKEECSTVLFKTRVFGFLSSSCFHGLPPVLCIVIV